MDRTLYFCGVLLAGLLSLIRLSFADTSEAELWKKLGDGGLVVLMRHASVGERRSEGHSLIREPSCLRERNLSPKGRDEASQIGRILTSKGIPIKAVLASPYCRTVETANLAFGKAEPAAFLSLLEVMDQSQVEASSDMLSRRIGSHAGNENLIMVTHEPNIAAISFESVEKGSFLVLKPMGNDNFEELGKVNLFR